MKTGLALLVLASCALATGQASARDCRVPHLADQQAMKPPPGCDVPAKTKEEGRLRQQNGFIDLGNGTQVRIGGRVRLDAGYRR